MLIFEKFLKNQKFLSSEFGFQVLFFGIPIGLITGILIMFFFHLDIQMVQGHLDKTEHHHIELRDKMIRQNVIAAITGIRILRAIHDQHEKIDRDPELLRPVLEASFLGFCDQFKYYRRIRKITALGIETTRVNCRFSPSDNTSSIDRGGIWKEVGAELEQALPNLGHDEVYISGFDTITSGSKTGQVITPILHVAMQMGREPNGTPNFLVVDLNVRHFLSDNLLAIEESGRLLIVEENGRFIRNPLFGETWSQTLTPGNEVRFEADYPLAWLELKDSSQGMTLTTEGLFSYSTLHMKNIFRENGIEANPLIKLPKWKIVSIIPPSKIPSGWKAFILKFILLIPAPLIIILYLAYVAVRRSRAVKNLEKNEHYLSQIMDSVVDGIVTSDQDDQIEKANAAALTMFGFDAYEDSPTHLSQLIPLDKLHPVLERASFWQASNIGVHRLIRTKFDVQRRDGSKFPAEIVCMEAELGGKSRLIWIIRDISEREELEAKRDAERMQFFHQTKMAEIGLIASGIIHEVGNPIAAISGLVSQMTEDAERGQNEWSQETQENLGIISTQVDRLSVITREISDFVRIRPGVLELFDLNSLIRSTIRLVGFDVRWKKIQLDLDIDPKIPALMGIQDQIAQVLMNLLVNAGDAVLGHSNGVPRVEVSTQIKGSNILLKVTDNGHGMSQEIKKQAFNSFFTTKPEGKGTGLGLSLCQTIVSSHQGTITINSEEGKGSEFQVSFPVPNLTESMIG